MKTHIALVGSQPIPVYLGIKWSGAIDKLILVCSEETKEESERLAICCTKISHEIKVCDSVNLAEIEQCAQSILEGVGEGEVDLNLTSGTKAWTMMFYKLFSKLEHSHFILVDQNNRIQDLDTYEERIEGIPTELRFLLHGAKLTRHTNLSEYGEEDIKVMRWVQKARKINPKAFNELTVGKTINTSQGRFDYLIDGSYLEYDAKEEKVILNLYNRYTTFCQEYICQSPHALDIVFNSGWFELKTALEISHNKHVQEVWLNCEFAAQDNVAKNEIDIIADMGTKLVCIECKTQVKDITAVDKFHSAVKNFCGLSSKGIFVVNDSPSMRNGNYRRAMEKCRDNNILTFNFSEYNHNHLLPSLNAIVDADLNINNKR